MRAAADNKKKAALRLVDEFMCGGDDGGDDGKGASAAGAAGATAGAAGAARGSRLGGMRELWQQGVEAAIEAWLCASFTAVAEGRERLSIVWLGTADTDGDFGAVLGDATSGATLAGAEALRNFVQRLIQDKVRGGLACVCVFCTRSLARLQLLSLRVVVRPLTTSDLVTLRTCRCTNAAAVAAATTVTSTTTATTTTATTTT